MLKLLIKNLCNFLILLALVQYISFSAQNKTKLDSVKTEEVTIISNKYPQIYLENARIVNTIDRNQIINSPVKNLSEILEYYSGIDVRQRGVMGVQSDISLRGGSYEQTLILVNGVPMNNAQTGHHNMNLPIDAYDIEKIEILEGAGARILGLNAFSGAVNIITRKDTSNVNLNSIGGEFGSYKIYSSATFKSEKMSNFISFSKSSSDGYIDNTDFRNLTFYSNNDINFSFGDLNIQFGYNNKAFGANSFYTAAFPNQFEATRAINGSISFNSNSENWILNSTIYSNLHYDRFELFRFNPADWYTNHNFHKSMTSGLLVKINNINDYGITTFGTDIRLDNIKSNVLGITLDTPILINPDESAYYTKAANRENYGFFIDHIYKYQDFTFSGGMFLNYNTDWDINTNFGLDISYKLDESSSIFTNFNQANRLPTYTDLYYEGPTNLGNPNLIPEKSNNFELGYKYLTSKIKFNTALFMNRGENLIDWSKLQDTLTWQATNVSNMNTYGISTNLYLYPKNYDNNLEYINYINFGYQYIYSEKIENEFLTLYNLDFLRHKLSINTQINLFDIANWDIRFGYQKRNGTYFHQILNKEVNYEDIILLDTKISVSLWNKMFVFGEVSNVLDKIYQDLGNVYQPGRWVRLGVELKSDI